MVSPVAGSELGQRSDISGPPIHIPPSSFPTSTSPCFLHHAFFITYPPPLQDFHALSLSPSDTSAVTISHGKGNDYLTKASGSGTTQPSTKKQVQVFGISFGVVDSGFALSSPLSCVAIFKTLVSALRNWLYCINFSASG